MRRVLGSAVALRTNEFSRMTCFSEKWAKIIKTANIKPE